ncbi:hypothetical protein EIK76_00295 [Rheinheimera mesophila]|uniref:Uncharacterized protein n=1 Tax=Rheinheimera mesophila TaxID=1547515 RepID=A0A3P3QMX7_9GAMM|nr:hypothetical protein [Rheinheimera mesophila]KKL00268.1 hypothetical protein SD53_15850 [Rheinheimera mesophila]RRJ22561.1 hypothetical protein EIK76_00295 [Rheinheimera mesophila]
MNTQDIVARNLASILKKLDISPNAFSSMCKQNGIQIDKSMLSRFNKGSSIKLEKLDELVRGLRLLKGFEELRAVDLLAEDVLNKGEENHTVVLRHEQLEKMFSKLFVDLAQLSWAKLNTDVSMQTLVDFSVYSMKNAGFEVVKSEPENDAKTL